MEGRTAKRVGVVILGDEVLRSEVRDANIEFLLSVLNDWGADVALCAILPDDVPTVVRHLRWYLAEADLLVLTGGIGPTPDDITREAVAAVVGSPLVVHPEAKSIMEAYYGDGMNEARMTMAQTPAGAVLIPNPVSGAPGFFVSRMAVFPGIPRLVREMVSWLKPLVKGKRASRVILYSRAPESCYAAIMQETMARHPEVRIGSYPLAEGEHRVRIVFRSEDFARAAASADEFTARLRVAGMEVSGRTEERKGDDGA